MVEVPPVRGLGGAAVREGGAARLGTGLGSITGTPVHLTHTKHHRRHIVLPDLE